jgi:hypothetical protein
MPNRRYYLLGRGELLTDPINLPHGGSEGRHPYTMDDAKRVLRPKIKDASRQMDLLPSLACPNDEAVALLTLHPKYLSKTAYPTLLLEETGLRPVGSRAATVAPRKTSTGQDQPPGASAELFIAGRRQVFRELEERVGKWGDTSRGRRFHQTGRLSPHRPTGPRSWHLHGRGEYTA